MRWFVDNQISYSLKQSLSQSTNVMLERSVVLISVQSYLSTSPEPRSHDVT